MRKMLITSLTALVAGLVFGGEFAVQESKVSFTTATIASNTVVNAVQISGMVEELNFIPTGTYTSSVAVYFQPTGASTPQYLYTNAVVTGEITVRPRVDATDNTGTALTSDPPTRYAALGGVLYLSVSNVNQKAATALKCIVKVEK